MGIGASGTDSKMTRMIAVTFFSVMAVGLLVWAVIKFSPSTKPTYVAKDQDYLGLNKDDDSFAVILMGTKQADARYIGTMTLGPDGKGWSPIHAIDFDRGANTMGMLRTLPKF